METNPKYVPRPAKSTQTSSVNPLLPGDMLGSKSFAIYLDEMKGNEVIGKIEDRSDVAFQLIRIDLFLNDSRLQVAKTSGENLQIGNRSVYIPFIRASMTEDREK